MKDSLNNFKAYYHFLKVKTIANPRDSVFEIDKEYSFDCFMAAYDMMLFGDSVGLEIFAESTAGSNVRFEKKHGDIIMQYSPKVAGIDTLKLGYSFGKGQVPTFMYFPMDLEILVLDEVKGTQ